MKYAAETFCSHAGLADNPAITAEEIKELERQFAHDPSQLKARRDGAFTARTGLALTSFDPERNYVTLDDDAVRELVGKGAPFAGIDFGAWRFAFVLNVADRLGRAHTVEEYFSQREELADRAGTIVKLLDHYEVSHKVPIHGDLANLTDIIELNAAFRRLGVKVQVMPVAAENKIRRAGVERMNDLLGRGAWLIRRNLAERQGWRKNVAQTWRLGMDAAHEGQPQVGSRLVWELGAWCYPEPKDGKAQAQDPDDHTADGADMLAAARYALMSWWSAAKYGIQRSRLYGARKREAEELQGKIPTRKIRDVKPSKRLRHPEFGKI